MTEQNPSPSLVDRVLTMTRERILTGDYAPGSRLRLNRLADESGVSLIPVREALRILEAERLVTTVPNKGATVTELSFEDMRDLYEVRKHLESEAVATSPPLTQTDAEHLAELLDDMKRADERGDTAGAMRLHRMFHFHLYERSESRWLPYLIDLLWKHAERYQWLSLAERHDAAFQEHTSIVKALQSGDPKKAGARLRSHLASTQRLLQNAYERESRLSAVDAG